MNMNNPKNIPDGSSEIPDESDWEYVKNMSDEEALANAMADPDAQPLTDGRSGIRMRDLPGDTITEKLKNHAKMRGGQQNG